MGKVLIVVMTALALAGCGEDRDAQLSPRSDVVVVLPPTPDLTPRKVVKAHPDGMLTVAGLIADRQEHMDQRVQVRGNLVEAHTCSGKGECYPPPHLVLSDGRDGKERLLVAGFSEAHILGLRLGQELTLTGRFGLITPDGLFIRQNGLLVVKGWPGSE